MPTFMSSYMPSLTTISFSGRRMSSRFLHLAVPHVATRMGKGGVSRLKVGYTKQHTIDSKKLCLGQALSV